MVQQHDRSHIRCLPQRLACLVAGSLAPLVILAGCSSISDNALPSIAGAAQSAAQSVSAAASAGVGAIVAGTQEKGADADQASDAGADDGLPAAHPHRARRGTRVASINAQAADTASPVLSNERAGFVARPASSSSRIATSADRSIGIALPPAESYALLARGLLRCTLRRDLPLAERYVFFGETPPGGRTATLAIHERTELGRHGRQVYKGDISGFAGSSVLRTRNVALPLRLANAISDDLQRWATGDEACARAPAAAAARQAAEQ